ncbi:hypothetical protein BST61_g8309 [Cercospora zeina]
MIFHQLDDGWGSLVAEFQLYSPAGPKLGGYNAFRDIASCPDSWGLSGNPELELGSRSTAAAHKGIDGPQ